VRILASNA